ncbi:hypothetical protein BS47DRAFT_1358681 [Hydnum rufescens UP504]|uniref:Uncharacterized protein n=1 Tax=Hydnum rufescens UP504 TaxID=1448309 RepID=A0A9P6DXU1_9AGAM|nr:hypothetical protein BS47DRAFT_1358681 [Hydnum rufescens UP504]
MANHSAMTWDKDQRLVKAEHGMNSLAYPLSQDFSKLSTEHHQESPKAMGVQVLYLQIAWALVYTNSMHESIFLGHPNSRATPGPSVTSTSLYDKEPSGLQESWTAYSWKDTSKDFDSFVSWKLVLGKHQFMYGIDDSMVRTVLEHPLPQTPWVQELMADGVPIFCIKDDWGNHEIEEQNVLKLFQGLAHVLTVQVHVPANTQHPLDWMIMPIHDESEPPIEDIVFWIINDGTDDHINLLQHLKQVFGNHIMNNTPDTESHKDVRNLREDLSLELKTLP